MHSIPCHPLDSAADSGPLRKSGPANEALQAPAILNGSSKPSWKRAAAKKRAEQNALIPGKWRLSMPDPLPKNTNAYLRTSRHLSAEELAITEIEDASILLQQIATQQLSAVQVLRAFSKRAAIAHQLINCCTELLFDEAILQAQALDEHMERTGRVVGPLHGLPVSLKDIFDIKGRDSTIGERHPA
jgi:amidase